MRNGAAKVDPDKAKRERLIDAGICFAGVADMVALADEGVLRRCRRLRPYLLMMGQGGDIMVLLHGLELARLQQGGPAAPCRAQLKVPGLVGVCWQED